jgi:antitoxin ParD1/3/4
LIVNPDAVVTLAVAYQRFKTVTRQCGKVPQRRSRFHTVKLQARGSFKSRECLDPSPSGEFSGAGSSGSAYKWLLANFASLDMMVSKFTSTEGPVTVPTRNVNLTDELDRFVAKRVKTGRYENASEVVRAGLRTLKREEQQYEAKLAALRAAIDDGDASGVADGDVFVRVRKALKLPASSR